MFYELVLGWEDFVYRIVRQRMIPFEVSSVNHLRFSRLYHSTMPHFLGLLQKKRFLLSRNLTRWLVLLGVIITLNK